MSMSHAILGMLLEKPGHCYALGRELDRRIGGGPYHNAQIAEGLKKMARRGYVTPESPVAGSTRDQKPFSITPDGRKEFNRWLNAPLVITRPPRDEVVIKLYFLSGRNPRQAIGFLEDRRRQLLRSAGRRTPGDAKSKALDDAFWADLSSATSWFRLKAELDLVEFYLKRFREVLPKEETATPARNDERTRTTSGA